MQRFLKLKSIIWLTVLSVVITLVGSSGLFELPKATAAELTSRSLEMSNSEPGTTGVTYNISFQITTPGPLGSVEFEFCSNSTFPDDVCDAPTGMDASHAVFTLESGLSGFLTRSETANDIIISRPSTVISAVMANTIFDNIKNPTSAGSFYLRVLTYATDDASGPFTDNGGMALEISPPINVQVKVPPYLLFCTGSTISGIDCSTAAGDFIDQGQLLPSRTSSGHTQMVIATNAQNGYSITATGNTLASGNNTIPSLSVDTPAQSGVSQFGINLRANTNPSVGKDPSGPGNGSPTANYDQPNLYRYVNGDVIASGNSVEDGRDYTISYITDISKAQPAGIYASTFTYVAMGNF